MPGGRRGPLGGVGTAPRQAVVRRMARRTQKSSFSPNWCGRMYKQVVTSSQRIRATPQVITPVGLLIMASARSLSLSTTTQQAHSRLYTNAPSHMCRAHARLCRIHASTGMSDDGHDRHRHRRGTAPGGKDLVPSRPCRISGLLPARIAPRRCRRLLVARARQPRQRGEREKTGGTVWCRQVRGRLRRRDC